MRNADFYADGQWNFYCDLCGRKAKSSEAMKTWDGFRVCSFHKEERNPQDFIRGIKDDQTLDWSRPQTTDTFVPIEYDRLFQDGVSCKDSLSKLQVKYVPYFASAGSPLNGQTLNSLALGASAPPPRPYVTPMWGNGPLGGAAVNAVAVNTETVFFPGSTGLETIRASDNLLVGRVKYVTEVLTIAEVSARSLNKQQQDTVHEAELLAKQLSSPKADTSHLTESLLKREQKPTADLTHTAESVSFQLILGTQKSLNGSALNATALN